MTASIYDTNLKLAGICDVFLSVCGEKDMKFGKFQAVAEASICLCGAERLPHIFIKLDLKQASLWGRFWNIHKVCYRTRHLEVEQTHQEGE